MRQKRILGVHPGRNLVHTRLVRNEFGPVGRHAIVEVNALEFVGLLDMELLLVVGGREQNLYAYVLRTEVGQVEYDLHLQVVVHRQGV